MPDITSRKNNEIVRLRRLLDNGAFRRSEGVFVCHGEVALREAAASGAAIEKVFALPEMASCVPAGLPCVTVSPEVLEVISGVETPQGVVFTCRMPENRKPCGKKFIALENVRDPGNIGTVIRTADAFGLSGVLFLGSCADCFAPKTVRSTMGSIFRVPLFFTETGKMPAFCRENGITLYAAALSEHSRTLTPGLIGDGCVMIGNEAHGLSAEAIRLADVTVKIPMQGAESLNAAVAAAVFMWEMMSR